MRCAESQQLKRDRTRPRTLKQFYEGRKTDLDYIDERLRVIVKLAEQLQPKQILDLACGRGLLMELLRERMPLTRIVGADISVTSLNQASAKGFEVAQADVSQELPFATGSFDCVIFGETIEHLIDPDFALEEISRVLSLHGTLILTTPNLASWFNRLLLLFGVQPIFTETSTRTTLGRKTQLLGQWNPVQGHLKIFTLSALLEMLSANGFSVAHLCGAPFNWPTRLAPLDKALTRFPSLASNLVIVARNSAQKKAVYPFAKQTPFEKC